MPISIEPAHARAFLLSDYGTRSRESVALVKGVKLPAGITDEQKAAAVAHLAAVGIIAR